MADATTLPLTLPPNASVFTRLRVGLQALFILADDNANPYYARLLHLSFDGDTYARLAAAMRQTDEGRRILDERVTIPGEDVDIRALERLPKRTLGHEFARYYIDNAIEPFSFEFPLQSDADFLNKRYRETHDIHHLITGYGVDEVGEVELQAFYLGNLGFRHAALIVLVSIPYRLAKTGFKGIRAYVRRLRAAYRRGLASRQLLSVSFDELWDQPVSEIAERVCAPARSFG